MNKKNIIAIAIVAIVVVAGIVVACTKDKDNQTSKQTQQQPAAKMQSPYVALCEDISDIWLLLDDAFVNDSVSFIRICNQSNTSSFMSMTGITAEIIAGTNSHANLELTNSLTSLGISWLSGWCQPCMSGGLPVLGQNVRELHNTLAELSQIDTNVGSPMFPYYIDSCVVQCYFQNQNIQITELQKFLCWINCIMSRDILRARNLLNALTTGEDE